MVALIRFGEEHIERTLRWLTDSARLREQIDCFAAPSREGHEACWRARVQDETREDYAIVDDIVGHAGNCGLSEIDRSRGNAQLWIYLGESEGRGIGGKAVRILLARAFDDLALERVYLRVLAANPRAHAFYKALGFVDEGRLRHDTLLGNDYVDSFVLSMLANEFRASKSGSLWNSS